jgi:CDGSH iron-sulfur domain-containing protein 3
MPWCSGSSGTPRPQRKVDIDSTHYSPQVAFRTRAPRFRPVMLITVNTNGPLKILAEDAAALRLTDAEGNVVPLPEGKNVFLCRCGASANKPFCDGAHKTFPFDGTLGRRES